MVYDGNGGLGEIFVNVDIDATQHAMGFLLVRRMEALRIGGFSRCGAESRAHALLNGRSNGFQWVHLCISNNWVSRLGQKLRMWSERR